MTRSEVTEREVQAKIRKGRTWSESASAEPHPDGDRVRLNLNGK